MISAGKTGYIRIAIILSIFFYSESAKAQKIELSPFAGYETGGRLYTDQGYLYVGNGMDYGASINYSYKPGRQFELSYSHMKSNLDVDEGYNRVRVCDLSVNYYSIGVLRELGQGKKMTPYGLASLGIVNYRPLSGEFSNENLVHFSFSGGVKLFPSEKIGLRLQARLLIPIWADGSYFTGDPNGTTVTVTTRPGAVQCDFTASVIFVLNR
jgi:hypothetical protein